MISCDKKELMSGDLSKIEIWIGPIQVWPKKGKIIDVIAQFPEVQNVGMTALVTTYGKQYNQSTAQDSPTSRCYPAVGLAWQSASCSPRKRTATSSDNSHPPISHWYCSCSRTPALPTGWAHSNPKPDTSRTIRWPNCAGAGWDQRAEARSRSGCPPGRTGRVWRRGSCGGRALPWSDGRSYGCRWVQRCPMYRVRRTPWNRCPWLSRRTSRRCPRTLPRTLLQTKGHAFNLSYEKHQILEK